MELPASFVGSEDNFSVRWSLHLCPTIGHTPFCFQLRVCKGPQINLAVKSDCVVKAAFKNLQDRAGNNRQRREQRRNAGRLPSTGMDMSKSLGMRTRGTE